MADLVHIDGKPFALVPLHEYRRLVNGTNVAESDLPEDILNQLALEQDHPVKIIRKFRGLTQVDLAVTAGISRPYLTEIETGKKNGSIAALIKIAKALQVSPNTLLQK